MSDPSPGKSSAVMNLPNQLTIARLVLSLVLFGLISAGTASGTRTWYLAALVVFVVAVGTDWLDGYIARKYNLITVLGRILDPFVDKVIICGTFIFLVEAPGSGVLAWMAVVIVCRELLVTALRSLVEGQGRDFSANMAGKLKMVLQSVAAAFSLWCLAFHPSPELIWPLTLTLWAAVGLTIYSGWGYVVAAVRVWKS